jgi:poly(hydroxyalkanoate) granule-associated protein
MAEKAGKPAEEATEEMERKSLLESMHKVLLVILGAVALAQEELEDLVQKLIERGEIAEQEGKKLVREATEKRKVQAKKAEDGVDKRIEEIVSRTGVPTKADIDGLSAQITALTKKVDELKKA